MKITAKTLPDRPGYHALTARPVLRIAARVAGYARQSDPDAKKKKTESKEMQTVDIKNWCLDQGWSEHLFDPYYADLGLSGTLRPDERPDMLRLFENIDKGLYDHGSIVCFQESRLFRDETQIYYNQFIEKCRAHDIVVVVVSPYLMIYDFQDEFLTEMFRWKCKEAADFIKRHIKGWLHPARERAAWLDGEWAGLGDICIGYIVDYDEKSPNYKKFIPYQPHVFAIEYLFRRFRELGGDITLLYRELAEKPLILPFFDEHVDPRNVSKFSKVSRCANGYIINNYTIIRNILTNVMYRGYRAIKGVLRRDRTGQIVLDHEAIIGAELFDFAYFRLAKTDFDGSPLDNGRKTRRYFHRDSDGEYGLLKFRIRWSGGEVHTRPVGEYIEENPTNKAVYKLDPGTKENPLQHHTYVDLDTEEIDGIVVSRLLEHVHDLYTDRMQLDRFDAAAAKVREERQSRLLRVTQSISDIEVAQKNLTQKLGSATPRRQELLEEEIDRLEEERLKLLRSKSELEKEAANDLGRLEDELVKLEECWPKYTFARRRALLNFLIVEVVADIMSTHWIRIRVLWLHEAWGREQLYYQRTKGKNSAWSDEEVAILKEYYPGAPKWEVMLRLPYRGWFGILGRAKIVGLTRDKGRIPLEGRKGAEGYPMPFVGDKVSSYADLAFMYQHELTPKLRKTNWERLSARSSGRLPPL